MENLNETNLMAEVLSQLEGFKSHLENKKEEPKKKQGPQTPEQKERVKFAAVKHGFTAQTLILGPDELDPYRNFNLDMMKELAPVGVHETFLANSVADEAWRLGQMRAQIQNLTAVGTIEGDGDNFNDCSEDPRVTANVVRAVTTRDNAKALSNLSLYMQRTQRSYEKYKKQLEEMQEKRKAKRAADLEEARKLSQLAELENLVYDPQADGFDFSREDLKVFSDRFHRRFRAEKSDQKYREVNGLMKMPLFMKTAA